MLILIVGFGAVFILVMPSYAALNCCGGQGACQVAGATQDSSCTNTRICNCKTTTSTSNGVESTTVRTLVNTCKNNVSYASCEVSLPTSECASGYYGTATSTTSGCTACPSNATCAGGNNSTFVCKKGYYKNGSSCSACPGSGTTSAAGATSISSCYIPSGTAFSDSEGGGEYTANCPY